MTNEEYLSLYRQARKQYPFITREALRQLAKTYNKAGKLAAAEVKRATLAGRADLTIESWAAIENQLFLSAQQIRDQIEKQIYSSVNKATDLTNKINEDYLIDAFQDASGLVTKSGVRNIFVGVNRDVITSMVQRIYQDGYTFSGRIWNAAADFQKQIKDVITTSLAQNRDLIKVAKDIQVYISDGKIALAKRYGELKRGTAEFMKRIGNKVDWRALRLVRTELYSSLQDAAIKQGIMNPACRDMYDWILEVNRQHWSCACPDAQAGAPYKLEDVPAFPHPSCRCEIRPILMDGSKFRSDIKAWSKGESIDYLDDWYFNQYSVVS